MHSYFARLRDPVLSVCEMSARFCLWRNTIECDLRRQTHRRCGTRRFSQTAQKTWMTHSVLSMIRLSYNYSQLREILSARSGVWKKVHTPRRCRRMHNYIIVRSKVTGQTSMNPLISANYFLPWILFTFKLPESFWNCFKAILQTQEMNFKKNPIENF